MKMNGVGVLAVPQVGGDFFLLYLIAVMECMEDTSQAIPITEDHADDCGKDAYSRTFFLS
jgi:hypothetical protein